MKKLGIIILSLLGYSISFAQKTDSIITTFADTINVHGKIVYENGGKIPDALIVTNSPPYNYFTTSGRTDKDGNFKLYGIKPVCNFWIYTENGNVSFTNNGSRYLLIKVPFLKADQLTTMSKDFVIRAKKIKHKDKAKIELKQIASPEHTSCSIDLPAMYPRGINQFFTYIKENTIYPLPAIENNIEGSVCIEFIVDKNGFISAPLLIKDIGYGCGEHLIKLLKQSKKWIPAMQAGKNIPMRFSIEIPFQLID